MSSRRYEFDAEILPGRGGGAYVEFPHDVRAGFGTGGRVPVRATCDGHAYRGSLAAMGGERHVLGLPRAIRDAIGKDVGDRVRVVVEEDTEPRTVAVPAELAAALAEGGVREAFDALGYTRRKELVRWVEGAKKPATRERRLREAVERVREGRPLS